MLAPAVVGQVRARLAWNDKARGVMGVRLTRFASFQVFREPRKIELRDDEFCSLRQLHDAHRPSDVDRGREGHPARQVASTRERVRSLRKLTRVSSRRSPSHRPDLDPKSSLKTSRGDEFVLTKASADGSAP